MASGGAIAAALFIGFNNFQLGDRLLNGFSSLITPKLSEPQVDVRSLVLQKVREASELTTAAFTMQAVVPTEQDASLGGLVFGKTKLLYIAHGEVKAGVDLSQLTAAQVQVKQDSIQIQLPPAQILDKKIDVNRSQVYDYNRGMLGLGPDVGPELQSLAQQQALQKITAAACEEGLLQKASDRARLVVTQLFSTAGYKSVVVNAQPVSLESCLAPTGAPAQTNSGLSPFSQQPVNPASSVSIPEQEQSSPNQSFQTDPELDSQPVPIKPF
jgi:hypothetical protein